MIVFPNAKINLGLHILSGRADGYHNLETLFYPVNIKDALEVIEHTAVKAPPVQWSTSGLPIPVEMEHNLCLKAFRLIKNDFPNIPPIKLHLHKNIPMGAGLGGGSADAAFTLCLINDKFNLGISKQKLQEYALQLGSDCPFFLINQPSLAKGRGEVLTEFKVDLSGYKLLVVNPGIPINTAWAFSKIKIAHEQREPIDQILQIPVTEWKKQLVNDFEKPVFSSFPEIGKLKDLLYQNGALYASMSGSGSSVFGIFEAQKEINFPAAYFYKWV